MATTLSEKLQDPLCETTRKQRRNLLLFSLIGIVVAKARIFPTEISALGVKFSEGDTSKLLSVLSYIILFFLLTFVVSSISEYFSLREWSFEKEEEFREKMEKSGGDPDHEYRYKRGIHSSVVLRTRTFFEFYVPILIALIAVIWLWRVDPPESLPKQDTEQVEQAGADQPTTAPESKPEGDSKPESESEGRSQ